MSTKKIFEIGPDVHSSEGTDFEWSNDSNYICVAAPKLAYILDKRGKKIKEATLPNKNVLSIDWDKDNEIICILQEGMNYVTLWQWLAGNLVNFDLDNSKYKASFVKWSRTTPTLAVGTDKGSLIFENRFTQKKVPTMGKHSKRIFTGDWNEEGQLITASEDRILTVSGGGGETIGESFAIKNDIRDLRWIKEKMEDRGVKSKSVSAIINNKALLIYDMNNKSRPSHDLTFSDRYGRIVDYRPFGDGYFVLSFEGGYYNMVSSHAKEMGSEVYSERVFSGPVDAMAVNENVYKLALAGENKIKFFNLANNKENKNETYETGRAGRIIKLRWSESGQHIVYLTSNGTLVGLLTLSLSNYATHHDLMAVCTSATEISIYSTLAKNSHLNTIEIDSQAIGLGIGPRHLAVQNGNSIKYYVWLNEDKKTIKGGHLQNEREYSGQIKKILMNRTHVAVMTDGRTYFHPIEGNIEGQQKKFPQESEKPIIGIGLTKDFLLLLDSQGRIKYYNIEDDMYILEGKSDLSIIKIFPNRTGTRLIAIDSKGQGYLFEPATESFKNIKNFPQKCERICWDIRNNNEFVAISSDRFYSFVITKNNIFNITVRAVRQINDITKAVEEDGEISCTVISRSNKTINLCDGQIFLLTPQANIIYIPLSSHSYMRNYKREGENEQGHLRYFLQNLSLKRFKEALLAAQYLQEDVVFETLGKKAIEEVEIELALKAYQLNQSLSMVLALQSILTISDRFLINGNCAMLLGKYDLAQENFLKSSSPVSALDMRCDVQDWTIAMNLAKEIAPEQEALISRRLATQIEAHGNNSEALKLYERSIITEKEKYDYDMVEVHNASCKAGIAKCCIKIGDVKRGYNAAREIRDPNHLNEIAQTCQNMKQHLEAADLYERAGNYEKSAALYLQLKMYDRATPLMQRVNSPKILLLYGKAKESERNYKEAEEAYEKAESWQNYVRINLNHLDNLEKPRQVLKTKCSTISIATLVAGYCSKRGLYRQAVEYLLLANKKEEAFVLAQSHDEMEAYADHLKDCSNNERISIAQVFEGKGKWAKAAQQYELVQDPIKAQKLYQKAGQAYLDQMIKMVVNYKDNQTLQQMVMDYIMGDTDGKPKDAMYAYKLYRQIGNLKAAARIAVTIASEDQEGGRYKKAHTLLFQTYQDIKKSGLIVPAELQRKLLILHSYTLVVKTVIKLGEHQDAAFLLQRVCNNISQFPKNTVKIITTAFVEAHRSNLKGLAYEYAVILMRSQHKDQVKEEYRARIENVARKPVNQQTKEKKSPCPFCGQMIPEFRMDCPRCLNTIPFCLASGKHLLKEQISFCPQCHFPANFSYLKRVIEQEKECPMCSNSVSMSQVRLLGESGMSQLKPVKKEEQPKAP